MKVVTLPAVTLGDIGMRRALAAVFGPDTLRRVHGAGTVVRDFHQGRRSFSFTVQVPAVPGPIRRFFCGQELRVTACQTLEERGPDEWGVTNRLTLHFVGAQLFGIHPAFVLRRDANGTVTLGGSVRHRAILPPPLKGLAEEFMAANTRKELREFARVLYDTGVIQEEPPAG